MSSRRRIHAACVVAIVLAGCADDEWVFRERDASAVDVKLPTDGPAADGSLPPTDVATSDVGPMQDAGTDVPTGDGPPRDVAGAGDVPVVDVPTVDAGPAVLTLRASGFTTTGAEAQSAGAMRLTETGFEVGERACVGALCLSGGFLP